MNFLAFDTSTDTLCIAVQRADALWQHRGPGGAQSSTQLLPNIQRLMGEADFQSGDYSIKWLEALLAKKG